MKTIFLFSILLCVIALPALGETSENTIETDIAVIKTEIKNLNEKIDDKFEGINDKFEGINYKFEGVNDKFEGIEKNFDRQNNIIIACIGIPLGILAIRVTVWGIFANRRSPKVNEQREQIEEFTREDMEKLFSELTLKDKRMVEQLIRDQEQKIEALTQEIEALKQQQTANP